MHRPPLLPSFLLVLTLLSLLAITIERNAFAQEEEDPYPPCSPPGRQPGTNGASWGHGANVTVVINANDFPDLTLREAIEAAFRAWQNANTNSGVTFTFITGTS